MYAQIRRRGCEEPGQHQSKRSELSERSQDPVVHVGDDLYTVTEVLTPRAHVAHLMLVLCTDAQAARVRLAVTAQNGWKTVGKTAHGPLVTALNNQMTPRHHTPSHSRIYPR